MGGRIWRGGIGRKIEVDLGHWGLVDVLLPNFVSLERDRGGRYLWVYA